MKFTRRDMRALAIVASGSAIHRLSDARFLVDSQSGPGSYYVVWRRGRWVCDCMDALKGNTCKHVRSISWALLLPRVLEANKAVVDGPDAMDGDSMNAVIVSDGRAISVHKATAFYRSALSRIGETKDVYPPRPPRPRLTKVQRGERP